MSRQRPLLGLALVPCAGACFSLPANSAKLLGATLPVLLFLWARYAFQAATMLAWLAAKRGGAGFHARRLAELRRSPGAADSFCRGAGYDRRLRQKNHGTAL